MAYIKDEVINEIRNAADIVDVISDYLKVIPKGKNFVCVCPFHDDHSPSLVISKERQIFNCFTCRTGGNVFSFVMKYENVCFLEAVAIVAKKIGYDLKINTVADSFSDKNKKSYEIMNFAQKYYSNNINTKNAYNARKYLQKRGINDDIISEFNIGLAPSSKDAFYNLGISKNYSLEDLDKVGLINKVGINVYDTFTNRIMIPIENLQGQVVGFTGRIFNGEKDTAKYMNSKETIIFKKSEILFNYHNAKNHIRDKKCVIVVEGNMDAIKMSSSGIKNVVALMGVSLSNTQIDTLKRLSVPVILMLDNDAAGFDATLKLGDILKHHIKNLKVVRLSDAKDPDEYINKFGVAAMNNNIDAAMNFLDFKLNALKENKNMDSTEDRVLYIKEVINAINDEDDLTKSLIISKISKDYQIDIDILEKEVKSVPKVKKEKNIEKKEPQVLSNYQKLSRNILYYMLVDSKYIRIYQNRLGYLKDKIDRALASEIIYYDNNIGNINIADFTTYIMNNEVLYEYLLEIIGQNTNMETDEKEFYFLIESLNRYYKKYELENLKKKIKDEQDINKKIELMEKLAKEKKDV